MNFLEQFGPYLDQLKNYSWGGNSLYDYIIALLIFLGLIIILKIFQSLVLVRLKKLAEKTATDFDDTLITIFKGVKPFYFFVALYFGIKVLSLPDLADNVIRVLFIIVIVYEVIRAIEKIIDYVVRKYFVKDKAANEVENRSMIRAIKIISKVALWAIGVTIVLDNLGIDVTSIIAGLGIGGIAVALAIQNILGDIFSSFSIYIDKPFQVGDFIVVGEDMGTVERIGLKTTRLRTLQGEEMIISNKELTSARVQNFKRMEQRRVVFTLGVVYGTKPEKLQSIPEIVKDIVVQQKNADFDRCHFKSFGDSSLDFEVVYFVNSGDYNEYMDINENINREIYNRFNKEKIEFAYPTQTVFIEK